MSNLSVCFVESPEMGQSDNFDLLWGEQTRIVVQRTVGPFDRGFEAPRREMSGSEAAGSVITERI